MNDIFNPYEAPLKALDVSIQQTQLLLNDPDLQNLAQEELKQLQQQRTTLQQAFDDYQHTQHDQAHALQDPTEHSNAILELRAGAGGDEAKIWAEDLLRMYLRYCETKGLKVEFIDDLVIKISGRAELEVEVSTENSSNLSSTTQLFYPYQLFKHEAGVHRVQRIPSTEAQGRIHTSTASVAVLPELKGRPIEIREEDLIWEFMRASGAGGQSVNKTNSAVRLTHQPSGIVVRVSCERKQMQNRAIALELLTAQLWDAQEQEKQSKLGSARSAIGRNMRAEKIRTYNYPQNRVSDHRIDQSWHQLDAIVNGDLDQVIGAVHYHIIEEEKREEMNLGGKG